MERDVLAESFEGHRGRLTAVAARILGSSGEAEDAVQETWLRLSRSESDAVENLGAWLTTVVSRVCLNMLQARRSRPEMLAEPELPEHAPDGERAAGIPAPAADPEQEALLAESVGLALLVVLETLSPGERVALVLHDMFAVPFEEIAPVIERSPAATRQLASRARRRVRGFGGAGTEPDGETDRVRHARVVDAFLAASRRGDCEALLTLLDPDVVLRSDATAAALGARPEVRRGREHVAAFLSRARGARPALADGRAAAVWIQRGRVRVVFSFTVSVGEGLITAVDLLGDEATLARMDVQIPERGDAVSS
jgi:RNA polymerase sigma-70 factor (ECF subfamily)